MKIDHKVGNLIHNLLVLGEYNSRELYQIHHKQTMKRHQEYIMAVKEAIKPGLMNYFVKPFTADMFKGYLHLLKIRLAMRSQIQNLNLSKINLDVSHGVNLSLDLSIEDTAIKPTERKVENEDSKSKQSDDSSWSNSIDKPKDEETGPHADSTEK